jgi:hypothetical protein
MATHPTSLAVVEQTMMTSDATNEETGLGVQLGTRGSHLLRARKSSLLASLMLASQSPP